MIHLFVVVALFFEINRYVLFIEKTIYEKLSFLPIYCNIIKSYRIG